MSTPTKQPDGSFDEKSHTPQTSTAQSPMTSTPIDVNERENMFTSPQKRFIGDLVAKTVREEMFCLQDLPKKPESLADETGDEAITQAPNESAIVAPTKNKHSRKSIPAENRIWCTVPNCQANWGSDLGYWAHMENCHLPEERHTSTCSLCVTVFHGRPHAKDLQVHLKRTSCGTVCVETKDGAEEADGVNAAGGPTGEVGSEMAGTV